MKHPDRNTITRIWWQTLFGQTHLLVRVGTGDQARVITIISRREA